MKHGPGQTSTVFETEEGEARGRYPCEYHPDRYIKHVMTGIGLTPFAIAVVTSLLRYFGLMNRPFASGDLIGIAATGVLALWFLFMVNQRVILYEDAIVKTTWLSTRRLDRENVLGWRGRSYRGYTYILVPRDGSRNLSLPPIFRWDKTFFEWKNSIPPLKN
jgi:hypothetical protein